jgi:GNAT superfamily N-acetyltransferase
MTTAELSEGTEDFVSVSPENAAYTQFLVDLKATGKLAGEAEYFVASDGEGDQVGRMAASVGPGAGEGLVGLFALKEKDSDGAWIQGVTQALLSNCEKWLQAKCVEKVYGPVDFSTWFKYRLRDRTGEESDGPDFSWEPSQPQSYLRAFGAAGYNPIERYHSVFYELNEQFPPRIVVKMMEPAWKASTDMGFEFVAFDQIQPIQELVPIIEAMSFDAFKGNLLYSPILGEVFQALYSPIVQKLDLSLSYLVRTPEGKEAGFVFAFEDSGYCVVKSIAVFPAYRKLRLSTALLQRCLARADEKGLTRFASALVKEGNVSEFLGSPHAKHPIRVWKHHYTLLGKTLNGEST